MAPRTTSVSITVHTGPNRTCWVEGCSQHASTCEKVEPWVYVALCASCFTRRRSEQRRASMHVVDADA